MAGQGKGKKCPHCSEQRWHDEGSHHECAGCGYIGWTWGQRVREVGQGSGATCPSCSKRTLHQIHLDRKDLEIRRCGTCNFTAIIPPRRSREDRFSWGEGDITITPPPNATGKGGKP